MGFNTKASDFHTGYNMIPRQYQDLEYSPWIIEDQLSSFCDSEEDDRNLLLWSVLKKLPGHELSFAAVPETSDILGRPTYTIRMTLLNEFSDGGMCQFLDLIFQFHLIEKNPVLLFQTLIQLNFNFKLIHRTYWSVYHSEVRVVTINCRIPNPVNHLKPRLTILCSFMPVQS